MAQNLLRVTQMNAIYFDKEILSISKQHLNSFFKFLPPEILAKCDPEINLLVRLCIAYYSVLEHNCTFGQKMLNIKYSNLTSYKKLFYIASHLFEYLKERFELAQPNSLLSQHFYKTNLFIQMLRFANVSLFLRCGTKPQLVERLLGVEQLYIGDYTHRHNEDKYISRQLIWNGFIEVLVYLLPLINYHKFARIVRNLNPLHRKPNVDPSTVARKLDAETTCAHCNELPVIPCHMGCSHVFCYYCLKGNQSADSHFQCPQCEYCNQNGCIERIYA